jgi:glycine/D-amino acid oxidase-like deaminating enzyme
MSETKKVAVVGCGIFGAEVAISLAQAGFDVTVYEASPTILGGASRNNQNRLHLGFHYPRDIETGRQSIRGFQRFIETYPDCIQDGFPNAYFIANAGSLTTFGDYLAFCDALGLPFARIDAAGFPVEVHGADHGILCNEVVYDCSVLRDLVSRRLDASGAAVVTGNAVRSIATSGAGYRLVFADGAVAEADVVVNCSYADINRLTEQLGYPISEREFEYTVVPIVEMDIPKVGITIMDGPFMTLLPYGQSDRFLLYAVENTVVARTVATQLDRAWLDPATSPFAQMDALAFFRDMVAACKRFVPALEEARMVGHLEGPRMVLARNHATDARPSMVSRYGAGYYTVFAGKIDHCVWVADDVCSRICAAMLERA